MSFLDLLTMSYNNLRRRKLRTFLTVLGVIIGTASIVVMVSLGLGMQKSLYEEAERSGGLNSMEVKTKETSNSNKPKKYITDEVMKQLKTVEHVKSVEPVLMISGVLQKGEYQGNVELTG